MRKDVDPNLMPESWKADEVPPDFTTFAWAAPPGMENRVEVGESVRHVRTGFTIYRYRLSPEQIEALIAQAGVFYLCILSRQMPVMATTIDLDVATKATSFIP